MNSPSRAFDHPDRIHEKCAVFGIYGLENAAKLTYFGLWALQHRGQESSGIATSDGKKLYRHAAFGLVANVYNDDDLLGLKGTTAIGHNRYSTNGGSDPQFNQPYVSSDRILALAHNGNLPLLDKLAKFLSANNIDHSEMNDSGMMTAAIDHQLSSGASINEAIEKVFPLLEGAFSVTAIHENKLIAFRDQYGIRPLSLAKLDGGYVVASETCAFDTIGAEFIRDIEPGELIVIDESGVTSHQIAKPDLKFDIFELVYFARPDSMLMGKNVSSIREKYGIQLAKEYKFDADIVVPVPDSSIPAALGYSRASGIPFEMALIKNRYINRTFISPTQELRERDVMLKLNPIVDLLKGKKIVLVDDSIVRGTTMKKVVKMLRGVGVKEINLLISSPPVKYPDFYGIDTPSQKDLIASRMSVKEIRQWLGVDWLGYLSYDGMIEATGVPRSKLCTSCFDGKYPSPIGKRADEITFVDEQIATGSFSHSAEDGE